MMPFLPTIFMLFISSSSAIQFTHPVEGSCCDLPRLKSFDYDKLATSEWYYHYANFGKEGDKCASGHAVARGIKLYIDLSLFDPTKDRYLKFVNDLTYHTDEIGVYTSETGAVGRMVATDMVNYFYYVQCLEVDGQNNVMALFATRHPEVSEEAQKVYKDISSKLADMKVLPPMHKINHTDCPPMHCVGKEDLT